MGLDADPAALEAARRRLAPWQGLATLVHRSYAQLAELATTRGFATVDGILLDLGFSSYQLEAGERGFGFQRDEPLDMRYDTDREPTAAHILNTYYFEELASLIHRYGEEPRARAIARAIIRNRPVDTSGQLAEVVSMAVGGRRGRTHPATRTFQALRIAVNSELTNLESVLPQALSLLRPGGRLATISYHSLEDRIVKQALAREAKGCLCPPHTPACICGHVATIRLITRKSVTPSSQEISDNPRSRSARLRVAERLPSRTQEEILEE